MSLLLIAAVALGSAFVPVLNIEAYLVADTVIGDGTIENYGMLIAAGTVAAAGQMAGKAVFFAAGRGLVSTTRLGRWKSGLAAADGPDGPDGPDGESASTGGTSAIAVTSGTKLSRTSRARTKAKAMVERAERRRGGMEALCLLSAGAGIPPFALMAIVLGATRLTFWRFVTLGLIGRAARFIVVILVAAAAT